MFHASVSEPARSSEWEVSGALRLGPLDTSGCSEQEARGVRSSDGEVPYSVI